MFGLGAEGKVGVHLAGAQGCQAVVVGRVGLFAVVVQPLVRAVVEGAVRHTHLGKVVVAAAQGDPGIIRRQVRIRQLIPGSLGCGGILGHIQAEIRLAGGERRLVFGAVRNVQILQVQARAPRNFAHQFDQNSGRVAVFVQVGVGVIVGVGQHGKLTPLRVELLQELGFRFGQ